MLHVVVVADGDPLQGSTNSGVAAGLVHALLARTDVEVVGTIDSRPGRLLSIAVRAIALHPRLSVWRNTANKGRAATAARSIIRDKKLGALAKKTPVDVVIHVRNTYRPCRWPYASFLDNTAHLSQTGWPGWALPRSTYRARERMELAQFKQATAVFTAGRHVADDLINHYAVPPGRAIPVGGGNHFPPQDPNASQRDRRSDHSILFVGKEFERKGGFVLLEAFKLVKASLPGAKLDIVGPTSLPSHSADLSGVVFHGRIDDREKLSQLYNDSSLFCLPALFEPYGLVVQEALSHGLPCIVTKTGALPELIGFGDAGIVVPPGDAKALANAILGILNDEDLYRSKERATGAQLQNSDWSDVANRMVPPLRELLEGA